MAEPRTRVVGLGVDVTADPDGDIPASDARPGRFRGTDPQAETAPPDDSLAEVSV
jgi:hypothetical protein